MFVIGTVRTVCFVIFSLKQCANRKMLLYSAALLIDMEEIVLCGEGMRRALSLVGTTRKVATLRQSEGRLAPQSREFVC